MRRMEPRRVVLAAMVLAGAWLAPPPAQAAKWCFEDIGCPGDHVFSRKQLAKLSCENLRHVRNAIYDENGYCFRSKEQAAIYDNKDCLYASPSLVPLNRFERQNVARIVAAERANGCK